MEIRFECDECFIQRMGAEMKYCSRFLGAIERVLVQMRSCLMFVARVHLHQEGATFKNRKHWNKLYFYVSAFFHS